MQHMQCDRDAAKASFTAIFFGAGASRVAALPPFAQRLAAEMRTVLEYCFAEADTPAGQRWAPLKASVLAAAYAAARESRPPRTPAACRAAAMRSFLAIRLQTIERDILLEVERELERHGRHMDTYIHDGGLVRKLEGEVEFPQAILEACEQAVLRKFNIKIRLLIKPMRSDALTIAPPEITLVPAGTLINDLFAARRLVEFLRENIIRVDDSICIYNEERRLWSLPHDRDSAAAIAEAITRAGGALIFQHEPEEEAMEEEEEAGDGSSERRKKGRRSRPAPIIDYNGMAGRRSALMQLLPTVVPRYDSFFSERIRRSVVVCVCVSLWVHMHVCVCVCVCFVSPLCCSTAYACALLPCRRPQRQGQDLVSQRLVGLSNADVPHDVGSQRSVSLHDALCLPRRWHSCSRRGHRAPAPSAVPRPLPRTRGGRRPAACVDARCHR
jgi:hypothetical protein